MLDTVKNSPVNGLDLAALGETVDAIEKDSSKAKVGFDVTTRWTGQCRSETTVDGYTLAGERIARSHTIVVDEPCELLGSDGARRATGGRKAADSGEGPHAIYSRGERGWNNPSRKTATATRPGSWGRGRRGGRS